MPEIPSDKAPKSPLERGAEDPAIAASQGEVGEAVDATLEAPSGLFLSSVAAFGVVENRIQTLTNGMQAMDASELSAHADSIQKEIQELSDIAQLALGDRFEGKTAVFPEELLRGAKETLKGVSVQEQEALYLDAKLVIHDVNNKLAILMGYVDLLPLFPDPSKYVDRIKNAIRELKLLLSRPESASVDEAFALIAPNGPLAASLPVEVENLEGLDLSQLEPALKPYRLARILYNLIDNSKKAGAKSVKISLRKEEGKVVLVVKDDGKGFKGIEPVKSRQVADQTGHGNALPIAIRFCELAGGTMTHGDLNELGAEWRIELSLKA